MRIQQLVTLGMFLFMFAGVQAQADDMFSAQIHHHDDAFEFNADSDVAEIFGCSKATASQISVINQGNEKKNDFLQKCYAATENSSWCDQLVRPNPESVSIFRCTYGNSLPHQLIHPDEKTWNYAIKAVQLVKELERKGIRTCQIYNWWRPEPYNVNVGGAAGRHPYGTSVDVRLCSNSEAITAFNELCRYRKQGQIRAIGYYGGSALHFGVGDANANTWGRSCPN